MPIAVSVIGLGKLGSCMAAAIASKGVSTIGVDVNPKFVESVRSKRAPVFEPGLSEMLANCDGMLSATGDLAAAVRQTNITFIVVPTPSNTQGGFSLEYVGGAVESIGRALREKPDYHLIVLTSTVLPGSTEFFVKPLLVEASGKRCGSAFGLCYSPEFIALGSVLRDFLNPDFLLIGESDARAGEKLTAFYRDELKLQAPVARMSTINAELTKIALNTFVTTKITYANMIAEICERLPGGDVDVVTAALGLDRRIGPRYLKGALGYGGPCFPRDNQALAHLLEEVGVSAELPRTVDSLNRSQAARIVALVERATSQQVGRVAVLGLAYKPDTNVVEESQGIAIAMTLVERGYEVSVFDPAAVETARAVLGEGVEYASSVAECVRDVAAIVIATDWPEFRNVMHQTGNSVPHPVVIDGWRLLRSSAQLDGMSYCGIGLGQSDSRIQERLQLFVEKLTQPTLVTEEANCPSITEAAAG
jgi:UDPglucose 6-dehydrogenase